MLIGTPPQPLSLLVDTGSSTIAVNTYTSQYCSQPNRPCISGGSYDPGRSSSQIHLDSGWGLHYSDDTTISGDLYTDIVYFAAQGLKDVEFLVVDQVLVRTEDLWKNGIFGMGYANAQLPGSYQESHPSIFDLLIQKELIKTRAFSMWVDTKTSGHILFGGIDREKYIGDLATLPVVPKGTTRSFHVTLKKLGFSRGGKKVSLPSDNAPPAQVLLDSGTSGILLPTAMLQGLRQIMKIDVLEFAKFMMVVECDTVPSDLTIDFTFDAITIKIPISDLIFSPASIVGRQICDLWIQESRDEVFILGYHFLSKVYAVYNMDQNTVSLAPIRNGSTASDVIEIQSQEDNSQDSSSILDPKNFDEKPLDADGSAGSAPLALHTIDSASPFTDTRNAEPLSADTSKNAALPKPLNGDIFALADNSGGIENPGSSSSSSAPTDQEAFIPSDASSLTLAENPTSENMFSNEVTLASTDQGSDPAAGDPLIFDIPAQPAPRSQRGRRAF